MLSFLTSAALKSTNFQLTCSIFLFLLTLNMASPAYNTFAGWWHIGFCVVRGQLFDFPSMRLVCCVSILHCFELCSYPLRQVKMIISIEMRGDFIFPFSRLTNLPHREVTDDEVFEMIQMDCQSIRKYVLSNLLYHLVKEGRFVSQAQQFKVFYCLLKPNVTKPD